METLVELIATPSFSTKERAVVELIKTMMETAGFDEAAVDGLGNVIGRIGGGKRVIAFDAHIDTVFPGDLSLWSVDPFKPVIKNNRIFGRGTVDQKGGMASMIAAGRIIRELGLNEEFTILFTGTVMEEDCDGLCWHYLIKEKGVAPEFVVITEPTNMKIHRGQRGRMEMSVGVKGRSCHGSAPERGDNAAYKISKIALEIEKLNSMLAHHQFLGKGSVCVTGISSESPSQCAVPDSASLYLDRRLTIGEDIKSAIAEVKEAAARAGYPEAAVEVPVYNESSYTGLKYPMQKYYPTWLLDETSPCLAIAGEAFERLFDEKPVFDKWTFSTNGVTIMGIHGIPCVGFGPGDEVYAHAPDESCPVEHLVKASAFYAGLVARLNGKLK
ncbi:MAG: YgeY family selenium metabolism-linked hydrolase [Deltaproteobacteria bacterium]|nr:YgeY family selenium metabolism-linked hydrolase [Deltaproteobacteria bacterium]